MLSDLGIQEEFEAIFGVLGSYSPILVMIVVAIVLTLMVAPFSGTATTTAMGAMCYAALRSIGLAPVTCCVVFLFLISNEGCTPPQAAPIYIASGIAGLEDPAKIFKNLLFHFHMAVITMTVSISLCKIHFSSGSQTLIDLFEMSVLFFMSYTTVFKKKSPLPVGHDHGIFDSVCIETIGNQTCISQKIKHGIPADFHQECREITILISRK